MWDHQLQSSNHWLSLQSLPKVFHLPQWFLPQCNHRPSLQELIHFQSLLLRLRRSQLHKLAKNTPGSRPFQKKKRKTKKKTNHNRKEQATGAPPPLHPHHRQLPTTHSLPTTLPQLPTPQHHSQKIPIVPLEPEATTFFHSFDVWPLHRMQILPDGSTRYRLTREEKEQLKFLGLKNLFNTNWPTSGLPHKGLGRCKRT